MRFDAPFSSGSTASWPTRLGWLAAFALHCLLPGGAAAQYRFDNWTTEHGLPQNSILDITQTRDGYLWLTTFNGLVRFDGARFTVFDKNTPGISDSACSDLYEDAAGALWIGTRDGGLLRYQNGSFTNYTTAHGLPPGGVQQIQGGQAGELLVTTGASSAWWRNGQWTAEPAAAAESKIYLGRSGLRWSWDKAGLRARSATGVKHYALPVASASNIIYEDSRGQLWVALRERGVFKVQDNRVIDYTARLKLTPAQEVLRIFEDSAGTFWFGTANSGLIRFRDEAGAAPVRYTIAQGLSSNTVNAIYQDREGSLWIGTDGGGLNRLTAQFISGYSVAQGLGGNITHAVLADRAGNVWVATHVGLSKIADGVVTNYSAADGLPLRGLQALHEDRAGRLWIGSAHGLCSFKDGVFSPIIPNLNVWAILEDSQGNLWVGTHFGLFKFKDGVKTAYTTQDDLPAAPFKAIYEDRQGTLWFGTDKGLVKYRDGRFTYFTSKDGLGGSERWRVWSIYADADGVLWLGTFDSGLIRFKDGRFTSYTTAQGLYNNGAFQILEDARGQFWMSSFRGLYSVSKQQLNDFAAGKIRTITCTAYGKAEGLLSTDGNGGRQPSGIKTSDGKLWFTTLGGVVVVDQAAVNFNHLPPPVLIEGATIDRVAVPISDGVRVAPGQANLEINYTATSFIKPEQVRFRYQLVGQDRDGVDARARRVAEYAYLPPGAYTFKVIAANSDGIWNEAGASLRVVVVPPFYRTWWFRTLVALSVAGLVALLFRLRVAQLRKQHAAKEASSRQLLASREAFARQLLESQEAERKRIAAELHDSLGQNLLIIKNHALLGLADRADPAATEENLTMISTMTSQALDETRQIAYNLRPYQLDRFGLTKALQSMLDRVAEASEIEFHYEVDKLDGLFAPEAEMNLYRIVQESLNNILKHSRATEAELKIVRHGRSVHLRIADNGQGFAPEADAELSKRGFGLTGMAERVRMLGGQYQLQSKPGEGTAINIEIALKE